MDQQNRKERAFPGPVNLESALVTGVPSKRQNEGIVLGYVAARIVESTTTTTTIVGIVSLLAVVTMRRAFAGNTGTDAATLVFVGGERDGW